MMTSLDLRLGMLRVAWRAAKTPEEKLSIEKHAELVKHPATPQEEQEIKTGVAVMMTPPDITHPYWDRYRKQSHP